MASAQAVDQQLQSGTISGAGARQTYDSLAEGLALANEARRQLPEIQALFAQGKKLTPEQQAQRDYFAIFDQPGIKRVDGSLNFDAYEKALADWQAAYPLFSKSDVSPANPLSPGHADLMRDRLALRPYWDNEDAMWGRIEGRLPPGLAGGATSLDEFREVLIQRAVAGGQSRNQAELNVQEFWSTPINGVSLAEMERIGRAAFLAEHREFVPLLLKWNYNGWRKPPQYLADEINRREGIGVR